MGLYWKHARAVELPSPDVFMSSNQQETQVCVSSVLNLVRRSDLPVSINSISCCLFCGRSEIFAGKCCNDETKRQGTVFSVANINCFTVYVPLDATPTYVFVELSPSKPTTKVDRWSVPHTQRGEGKNGADWTEMAPHCGVKWCKERITVCTRAGL